jgi:DNA-directed RNA polymerase specialized sigma24 family protein
VKNNTIAELYQQYGRSIFMYLRLHTPSREDAEDILVEVFLAALEQNIFEKVPTQKHQAWLWRVAENKLIDLHRRNKRRQTFTLDYTHGRSFAAEGDAIWAAHQMDFLRNVSRFGMLPLARNFSSTRTKGKRFQAQ